MNNSCYAYISYDDEWSQCLPALPGLLEGLPGGQAAAPPPGRGAGARGGGTAPMGESTCICYYCNYYNMFMLVTISMPITTMYVGYF